MLTKSAKEGTSVDHLASKADVDPEKSKLAIFQVSEEEMELSFELLKRWRN